MDKRELNRERRRQRALERLGTNDPRCVVCGYDDPLALELHHVAGHDFAPVNSGRLRRGRAARRHDDEQGQ